MNEWIEEDLVHELETILLWAISGSWLMTAFARCTGVFGA